MKILKFAIFFFISILVISLTANIAQAQYRPSTDDDVTVGREQIRGNETAKEKDVKGFYLIGPSYWPKIEFFGVYSSMIVWISFILGIAIFLMARYAGARVNKVKIWLSIFSAVFIGMFSRSLNIFLRNFLYKIIILVASPVLASSIADFISYFLWLLFTAGVAVHLYEIFTVTAKEVFLNR
ncbi:hypothetical protein B6D60_03745 [candidate division KSB1 bacterium 4484_87]|nr:MAG: hypothetical protein B6D60_03745 [candidate division KSB1 bacterium 4484_87]